MRWIGNIVRRTKTYWIYANSKLNNNGEDKPLLFRNDTNPVDQTVSRVTAIVEERLPPRLAMEGREPIRVADQTSSRTTTFQIITTLFNDAALNAVFTLVVYPLVVLFLPGAKISRHVEAKLGWYCMSKREKKNRGLIDFGNRSTRSYMVSLPVVIIVLINKHPRRR